MNWSNKILTYQGQPYVYEGYVSAVIERVGTTTNGNLRINARMNEIHHRHDGTSVWWFYYKVGSGTYTAVKIKDLNASDSGTITYNTTVTVPLSDTAGSIKVYAYFHVVTNYGGIYISDSAVAKMSPSHGGRWVSPAPSGLAITRDGNKFEFSWKIPSRKYAQGQALQWRVKENSEWKSWQKINIGTTDTKASVTINPSRYRPSTETALAHIAFRVCGKSENSSNYLYLWSDWTEKRFDILSPNTPTITEELDSTYTNVTTFEWTTSVSAKATKWFTNTEWQTILVKNCNETDGSKLRWKNTTLGWSTGTAGANGSITRTEDTALLANDSYTRWVRVRARGPQGNSYWAYSKHVYAMPYQASVKSVDVKKNTAGGYNTKVTWEAAAPAAHPIDVTTVQYALEIPDANLACPSGASWEDAVEIRDTAGRDAAWFQTESSLTTDQCLYVRVNNTHDKSTRHGVATLARKGVLADPEDVSVSLNTSTYTATVTATNSSDVPDSFLAVVYRRKKSPGKDYVVGIIPHGSTSVACKVPNWTSDPNIAFGVYACVGSYSKKTRTDGTDAYAVTKKMVSDNTVWTAGDVPKAPTGVTLSPVDGTNDAVRVTWNWTWGSATSAELAWADHEDAWESTDEPNTYTVENGDATAWNITGLTPGKRWYVAVRLISEDVRGPWSRVRNIDLSSAPIKPSLVLSSATITKNSKFTAYWTFVSTDGTKQTYAKIVNTTVNNGVITRGKQLGYTETAQSLTMKCPKSWNEGELHYLSLKVTSASGHESEWSDPVAITVADPIECAITETSIVDTVIERDAETLAEASVLHFESDGAKEFAELTCHIEPKQSGSGTPSPTNLRPISGYEEVVVSECGKNLLNQMRSDVSYTGYYTDITSIRGFINEVTLIAGVTYRISFDIDCNVTPFSVSVGCGDGRYLRDISTKSNLTNGHISFSFTPLEANLSMGAKFALRVPRYTQSTSFSATITNLQLEIGSEDTGYEPYTGTTTTIQLGQTVYGGTLDVVSGVLTVDRAIVLFDGSQTPSSVNPVFESGYGKAVFATLENTARKSFYNVVYSNIFEHTSFSILGLYKCNINTNGILCLGIPNTITTVAEMKTWCQNNPFQICYELATPITVQLSPHQIGTLTGTNNVWANAGDLDGRIAYIRNVTALTEMPCTVTITGAGAGGTTTAIIERAEDYHVERPNESQFNGYAGETIAIISQTGEAQMTITNDMLLGLLDDEASYRLIAVAEDTYGQTAAETLDFEVHWAHQAITPSATLTLDDSIVQIAIGTPTGTVTGDYCDIYRLSADAPVLIYSGAEFGQTYVDPYPAIGPNGGHRIVYRTSNGDYITNDGAMAWVDIDDGLVAEYSIIDYGGAQIRLPYNLTFANNWSKDFKETKYLGGSVQGDWNPAVSRTLSMGTALVSITHEETITAMRRLAVYPGICHVRTPDGSSFDADIQVAESRSYEEGKKVDFSLSITRVDPEGYDGMTLTEWEART